MGFEMDTLQFVVLIAAAGLAGFIDAVAGGGGMITLPALLAAGLPPHGALGTNKLCGTCGTLSASRVYVMRGIFQPRRWRAAIAATFIGALMGTLATRLASAEFLNKLLPLLVMAAALYVLLHRQAAADNTPSDATRQRLIHLSLGGMLGFYDGFAGPGAGAFWTTLAMRMYRLDLLHAAGLARFMNLVSNATALITFMALGHVRYGLGLAMGASLMCGAYLGARCAVRYGASFIRPVFVTAVLLMATHLAWDAWLGG